MCEYFFHIFLKTMNNELGRYAKSWGIVYRTAAQQQVAN